MGLFKRLGRRTKDFQRLVTQLGVHREVAEICKTARHQEGGRLLRHGFKAYSQNDEDGILQEIFSRIGTTNRYFVEFGVEGGLENNTLFLLLQGWKGLWLEGDADSIQEIQSRFKSKLAVGDLRVGKAFVSPENFNELLKEHQVPAEIDLLSIDIDGNDYHVFQALSAVAPRVVVIEYNSKMHVPLKWVMKFNPNHRWDGSDYFGASLTSLQALGEKKGYSLVGCNITGVNAFFVRNDLLANHFCMPYTAANHFEPARYFLTAGFVSGHPANFGDYEAL